ncbi:MAG: alpha/beta hydrolase fold domain-containing protein [Devosiaceae bacterium]|nr:alpha/beta hydrolase fold domain-containing protein [Devosiaceae bacterium MH13]
MAADIAATGPTPYSHAHGADAALNPFDPALVTDETAAFNASLLATLSALPDMWGSPPHVIRKARADGKGPFPLEPKLDRAQWVEHEGVRIRVLVPEDQASTGVYLHIHGGGWTFGQADFQDPMLARLADATGLIAASVAYRLAPEHPYPDGPTDCLAAVAWAFAQAGPVFVGGESAGAHLALLTALTLRDQGIDCSGLVLNAGCYDLALTPSVRNWGSAKLVLNTRDIEMFAGNFVPAFMDRRSAAISPLYTRLEGLPPSFLSVGTEDPLLDDSLMLHQRLLAAGVSSQLAVAPGGCHVFHVYDLAIAREAEAATHGFIQHQLERAS